jgi:hypothetical protein
MLRRWTLLLAVLFAAATAAGAGAETASACDTSYWTVGCHYYSPQTGDTRTQLGGSVFNTTHATFSPYDTTRHIWTTAGGKWLGANTVVNGGWVHWGTQHSDDKLGCFNHHTGTQWVNCREYQGWSET